MSKQDNPYAPPQTLSSSKAESSQREPVNERPIVRVFAAFIALCFVPLLLTTDFRRLNFALFAVIVMSVYGCFAFGFVAVTGRWLSFRKWFR